MANVAKMKAEKAAIVSCEFMDLRADKRLNFVLYLWLQRVFSSELGFRKRTFFFKKCPVNRRAHFSGWKKADNTDMRMHTRESVVYLTPGIPRGLWVRLVFLAKPYENASHLLGGE